MKMITPYVANENRDMKVKERKGENSGPHFGVDTPVCKGLCL